MTDSPAPPPRPPVPKRKPRKRQPKFTPARPRRRHDGWSPDCQSQFLEALSQLGCVVEACRSVGKSPASAYKLRQRWDAGTFRLAWDRALDFAIARLNDAVLARAINGVATPVFYQGEQIGEKRHYDERLAMFLLRYRDPDRYGKWRDKCVQRMHPDARAFLFAKAAIAAEQEAWDEELGVPPAPIDKDAIDSPFFVRGRRAEAEDEDADEAS